ncbi:PQQ-dependent sugar dehydrogenase [Anaerolineales bacterium HSG6]|nr:PQQ-dependent sugar dehydrogenase [Anaerolineales bacterium HSG6]
MLKNISLLNQNLYLTTVLIWLIVLSACQTTTQQPPLPTIVEARATVSPTATSQPTITPSQTNTPHSTETPASTETPLPENTATMLPTTTSTDTPQATATLSLDSIQITLNPITGGFSKPVYLTHADDQSGRLFVVEQAGRIVIIEDNIIRSTLFLDIVDIVGSSANEQGLLSMAFHPDYTNNGYLFVNYTNLEGHTVIAQYQVSAVDPNQADKDSEQILLTIPQPYGNHNGGQILFGPDGYLYVGMGDGGAANDPQNNAQDLERLLGKILRIDIDQATPYGVPDDNPFVSQTSARPEIWSYGWRNPWRISFDRLTGDMYIADVGQNQYEEIHVEEVGTSGGGNYGWRLMEGRHCFNPSSCDPDSLSLILPITEYDHDQGCSITGGYVYRGQKNLSLKGIYIYGDYCTGLIWGLRQEAGGVWSDVLLSSSNHTISSFGEDEDGELYLLDHQTGQVMMIK